MNQMVGSSVDGSSLGKDTETTVLPPSKQQVVLRVSETPWKHDPFEEIADKLNFKGHRIENLRELVGFLCYQIHEPNLIIIDKDLLAGNHDLSKLIDSLKIMLKIRFDRADTKFAVLVSKPISKQEVKHYKSVGMSGLAVKTGNFNYHLALKSFDSLLNGQEFWPSDCIIKSPSVTRKVTENPDGIHLTDRQIQVQKLLCERGLSNKAIARQLNISESTVKIHVSAILKRYAVRNRTQLALAAKNQARL